MSVTSCLFCFVT